MFLDLLAMCEEFEVRLTQVEAGAKEFQKSANTVDKWHSNTWECIAKNLVTKQKEDCEDLMNTAFNKLDKADCVTNHNDRLKKVMESKAAGDDARMKQLEEELRDMQKRCEDADNKYDEIQKKVNLTETELEKAEVRAEISEKKLEEELKEMQQRCEDADNKYDEIQKKVNQTEADLDVADLRAEIGEHKIIEMEEELQVVANNLRSLEVSEEKANKREKCDRALVATLTAKLKQAEARAQFAEKSVQKLQNEVNSSIVTQIHKILLCRWTSWKTSLF